MIRAFASIVEELNKILQECRLCPRECGVDRLSGEQGFCRTGAAPIVSSWGPHFGEERPLVGRHGSGTIFFTHCNLGCLFCQNGSISHNGEGSEKSVEELSRIMRALQERGCHNINLVTPTHQVPAIVEAILTARERGLNVPIVYNCGGYESVATLKLLEGIIDIYMPDIKYMSSEHAQKYSYAGDYPDVVKAAVREMHRQVGDLVLETNGVAVKGLLVRHLVMPGNIADTQRVASFLAREVSRRTYVNIMDQYRPCYKAYDFPELSRRITGEEYRDAVAAARRAGLTRLDGVAE